MRDPKIDERLKSLNSAIESLHRLQNDYESGPTWEILFGLAISDVQTQAERLLPWKNSTLPL
jgi:hypothetical protein